MIYLLKFGASFFLPPGIFFVILFYIAYRLFKTRERKLAMLLAAVTGTFYLLSTAVVADALLRSLEGQYEPPKQPAGDVIVMLGGGAMKDTQDVSGSGTLTSAAASRLLTTVRLYQELRVPILLSGGQVFADSGAEAEIARRILLSMGVPEKDIIVENRSLNTTQNATYSAEIIRQQRFKRPLLVTSAFHMPRSMLCFTKQGIDALAYPTDYQVNPRGSFHYNKIRPNPEKLYDSSLVLQELLRIMVTKFIGV